MRGSWEALNIAVIVAASTTVPVCVVRQPGGGGMNVSRAPFSPLSAGGAGACVRFRRRRRTRKTAAAAATAFEAD